MKTTTWFTTKAAALTFARANRTATSTAKVFMRRSSLTSVGGDRNPSDCVEFFVEVTAA